MKNKTRVTNSTQSPYVANQNYQKIEKPIVDSAPNCVQIFTKLIGADFNFNISHQFTQMFRFRYAHFDLGNLNECD